MVTQYPATWADVRLGDLATIVRGASPRPIDNFLTDSPSGTNWIKIGDAPRKGRYISSTAERVTKEGAEKSVHVVPGDLILSNSMSFGRPYILRISGCIHDGWLRLSDFDKRVDVRFLAELLASSFVYQQYESLAAGSGVQNLNKEVVRKVAIPLPSLPEQQAIADVLSGFDEHLANLDALIAKKQAIRDGALEELVSGTRRIPGFSQPWRVINFAEEIIPKARIGWQGLKAGEYLRSGYSLLISGTDFEDGHVSTKQIFFVSRKRYEMDPAIQVQAGDVLVTKEALHERGCSRLSASVAG